MLAFTLLLSAATVVWLALPPRLYPRLPLWMQFCLVAAVGVYLTAAGVAAERDRLSRGASRNALRDCGLAMVLVSVLLYAWVLCLWARHPQGDREFAGLLQRLVLYLSLGGSSLWWHSTGKPSAEELAEQRSPGPGETACVALWAASAIVGAVLRFGLPTWLHSHLWD
jgi:hypothetical protein